MPTNQKKEKFFFFCIGLAAILLYSYTIYTHAINIPKWDDFPDILQFMDRWLQADSLAERFSVFLYHTNEHILLVNHVIILIQYYLIGHIDFRWLIYTGNLFYLGSAFLLWLPFRNKDESAIAFAVLMLTAATFYSYESTLWALTAISNQAVIFFSLLALWCAAQASPSLSRVIPLTLLAIFSQSNGFLLLPVIGTLFFISCKQKLLPWLTFSALAITGYAFMLDPASYQGKTMEWTAIPPTHYGMAIPAFIAIFGSTVFNEASVPAFIASFLLGSAILFFTIKQIQVRNHSPFILYVLLFFGLCMASIALYRGLITGPSVIFTSRYKMYGIYFLAAGLLLNPQWLALYKASPWWRYSVLLLCFLFFSASFYLNLPKSTRIDGDLRESLEYWVEDGDFRRGKGYFIKDSDSYLFAALHHELWSPLSLIEPDRVIRHISVLETCPDISDLPLGEAPALLQLRHINRNAPGIRVDISSPPSSEIREWQVYLCSDNAQYRLQFMPRQISPGLYPAYYIPAKQIAPGNYRIYARTGEAAWSTDQYLLRKPHTR